jgi:predicted transcriptional regulator
MSVEILLQKVIELDQVMMVRIEELATATSSEKEAVELERIQQMLERQAELLHQAQKEVGRLELISS